VIDIADIEAARVRIAPWIRQTPVAPLTQLKTTLPEQTSRDPQARMPPGHWLFQGARRNEPPAGDAEGSLRERRRHGFGRYQRLAVARGAYAADVPGIVYVPASVSPVKVAHMKAWNAGVEIIDGT
jgi:threonine dehydratase